MILNLIKDAATVEIGGTLVWQWVHHPRRKLDDDRQITAELVLNMIPKELAEFRGVYDYEKMHLAIDLIYFACHRRGV